MKKFFKDYWVLCKQSLGFCKKHWLGMAVMYIVTFVMVMFTFWTKYFRNGLIENVKDKFRKDKEDK